VVYRTKAEKGAKSQPNYDRFIAESTIDDLRFLLRHKVKQITEYRVYYGKKYEV